jgi:hypothetical protein
MFRVRSIVPLLAVAALSSGSIVHAQESKYVELSELDIGFKIPEGYRSVPSVLGEGIELRGPLARPKGYTSNGTPINVHIITGIYVIEVPVPTNGLPVDVPTEETLKSLMRSALRSNHADEGDITIQNTARFKIGKRDAVGILGLMAYPGLGEDISLRIILLANLETKRRYVFLFGAINEEFESKVKAFESMMGSLKFLSDPAPTPAPPAPKVNKTQPAKPKKKK